VIGLGTFGLLYWQQHSAESKRAQQANIDREVKSKEEDQKLQQNAIKAAEDAENNRLLQAAQQRELELKRLETDQLRLKNEEAARAFALKQKEEIETKNAKAKEDVRILESIQRQDAILRYLRITNTFKEPGQKAISIAVAGPLETLDDSFATELAESLASTNATSHLLFTDSFAKDGVMKQLFNSNSTNITYLNLPSIIDAMLLAYYKTTFSTNASLNNIITATIHLECKAINTSDASLSESISADSAGAGFSNSQAEASAKERLLKTLTSRKWLFLKK